MEGTVVMHRRTFLAGLAWIAIATPARSEPAREQQLAQLLLGEPVWEWPAELAPDFEAVLQRLPRIEEASLERALANWPAGRQSCQRILTRLLDPWKVCSFANRPGQPPPQAANWGRPWPK